MNRYGNAVLEHRRPGPGSDYLNGDKIDLFVRKEPSSVPTLVFTARGRLDYYNAGAFQAFIRGHLGTGPVWAVLDLAGLIHLASSGINALVELSDEIARMPGDFVLVAVPPAIRQWTLLLGLDGKLADYPTLKDALDDLGQPQRHRRFRPAFPTTVPCPSCGRRLQASREGKFRCASCRMPFQVDHRAQVSLV